MNIYHQNIIIFNLDYIVSCIVRKHCMKLNTVEDLVYFYHKTLCNPVKRCKKVKKVYLHMVKDFLHMGCSQKANQRGSYLLPLCYKSGPFWSQMESSRMSSRMSVETCVKTGPGWWCSGYCNQCCTRYSALLGR